MQLSSVFVLHGWTTELLDTSLEELSTTFSLLDSTSFSELEDSSTFTELDDSSTFAELLLEFALLLDTFVSLELDCGVTLDEDSSQSSQMLDEERITSLESGLTF